MVNIDDIKEFVDYQLNKSQSGGTLSPTEYNTCLSWCNLEYYKLKIGLPEAYRVGSPLAPQMLDITQKAIDDMRTFRTSLGGANRPPLAIDQNGWALYPSDYVHVSSITTLDNSDVEVLRDDFLANRLSNSIKFPTASNPICVLQDTFIEFYPKNLGFVKFNYMRLPVTPVWDYTILNDQPVYKPNTSVQFEWPQDVLPDLAAMILRYASTNLRDQLSIQLAEQRKTAGI